MPAQEIPTCEKCGQHLEIVEEDKQCVTMACGFCDLGGCDHMEYVREFTCWNCAEFQQAGEDRRSKVPGMGHHCIVCGKDLTEWFKICIQKGLNYAGT
jgi:hypothetical protein